MHGLAEKSFYTLSAVALGAAFFVLQPTDNPDVANFKNYVKEEFRVATIQVIGDQPVFEGVDFIITGITEFYDQSTDAAIAILTPAASEGDLTHVASGVYNKFAMVLDSGFNSPQVLGIDTSNTLVVPENFMQEEPVYNIVPEGYENKIAASSTSAPPTPYVESAFMRTVSDSGDEFVAAVNDYGSTWVNLRDKTTGQVYCVAIFNAEVNRYLGPCRNDYY